MATAEATTGIFKRLDQLNEFERQPVAGDKLHGGMYFAGSFAGEHVAATEFVIGALFVIWGATAFDVLVGLLLGNALAVLSWTLICAPIAADTRLTLYWYLRKIAGPVVTVVYNVLNAVLYCILAGCMITVAASAVRIPFGIEPQTGWLPTDPYFVAVVIGVGAVVVTLAILGFKRLAQFASVCSPWMFLMFLVGGLVLLPQLGWIRSFSDFWRIASDHVWTGPEAGQTDAIGFWHVAAFAWICNLAMHLGLSDMALLRYARRAGYGLYSAFGMYLGHYLAWICAGVMGAVVASLLGRPLTELDSGEVAFQALGVTGALAVVIAGWTTSNPTLYRAGLALQVVSPGWPRWLVTLVAGVITTAIACFPFVFRHLLDFVAIYGILLMPVGVIVVVEHWIFPRIGFARYWSARKRQILNWPAMLSWAIVLGLVALCWVSKHFMGREILHEYFLFLPAWILTAVLYVAFAALAGAGEPLPELERETAVTATTRPSSDEPPQQRKRSPFAKRAYYYSGGLALVCLILCVGLAICVFAGLLPLDPPERQRTFWHGLYFKRVLIWITAVYFVSGTIWMTLREKRKAQTAP
jgi:cytosine permease